MIKLKNILNEIRRVPVNINSSLAFMRSKCSLAVGHAREGRVVYRGVETATKPAYYLDPSKESRTSKDTNNLYQAIMATSPNWDGYPNREQSVMFSPMKSTADEYGEAYFVFVPDDANIVMTTLSHGDFWHSMDNIEKRITADIPSLMNIIKGISNYSNINPDLNFEFPNVVEHVFTSSDVNKFYEEMKKFTKEKIEYLIQVKKPWPHAKPFYLDMLKHYDAENGWRNYFNDLFDPQKNKIKLGGVNDIPYRKDEECWTDSPVLLLSCGLNVNKILNDL